MPRQYSYVVSLKRENTTTTGMFGSLEKMILNLENAPWHGIYRTVIGFLILPLCHLLLGQDLGHLAFWLFLAILIGLKIVPGLVRRLLPVSEAAQEIWAERRRLGKRYDSYQWKKLFWIGLGLAGYTVMFDDVAGFGGFLAAFCLISGGVGFLMWRRNLKEIPRKR